MQQDGDYQMELQSSSSRRRQRSLNSSKSKRRDLKRSKSCKNFDQICKHTFTFRQLSEEINGLLPLEVTIKMCPQKQKIYDGSTEKLNTFPVIIIDEKPHMPLFVNECEIKAYMEHEEELLQNYEEKRRIQIKPSFGDHAPKEQFCSVCMVKYENSYLEHIQSVQHKSKYRQNQYAKIICDLELEWKKQKQDLDHSSNAKNNQMEDFENLKTLVDSEQSNQIKNAKLFNEPQKNLFEDQEKNIGENNQNIWNLQQVNLIQSNNKLQKCNTDQSNKKIFNDQSFNTNKRMAGSLSYAKFQNPVNSAFRKYNLSTQPDEQFIDESQQLRQQQFTYQSIKNICKTLKFEEKNMQSEKFEDGSMAKDNCKQIKQTNKQQKEEQQKKGFQVNKSFFKEHLLYNHLKQKQIALELQQKQEDMKENNLNFCSNQESILKLGYENQVSSDMDSNRSAKNIETKGQSSSAQKFVQRNNQHQKDSQLLQISRASSSSCSRKNQSHSKSCNGGYKFSFDEIQSFQAKEAEGQISQQESKLPDTKQKEHNYQPISKNKKRSFQEYNYQRGMQMSCEEEISINKKFKIFGIGTTEIKSIWQQFKDIFALQFTGVKTKQNN
ncbi:hypothetical protein TTHERM_00492860 (macronuclear) [Tetrahymena thermophila SB210]|uniref:DBF4-type domain-containing protein n=1 Tax=Tetrahymena thermophila (strain SB210) TaxID=312017 RepID=I7MHF6_TETTS|nr:hypothetical protein TTHERM_00492860 [Tetrahymena thermophila SB210]EAS02933.3 hypothetical protein TTHERM_00492860 [Tetrahymena thermophila SB210]|eukprot:XP_001023178.3 hypothetical protein TTHERM_00492860 [Tetrahymena thermophila SB210]